MKRGTWMFQITISHILYSSFLLLISTCTGAQPVTEQIAFQSKPKLQLATTYQKNTVIADYWVSEKLDGVRGYWTGQQLLTRNGNVLSPPPWFIENWPTIAMDGELWSNRGQFEAISSCIRRKHTDGQCWKNLKLMVFDLPHQANNFSNRLKTMRKLLNKTNSPYLAIVSQFKVVDHIQLYALLDKIVAENGEGLMLHLATANYQSGRSKNLLKLKKYQDAEAKVIAHLAGKGKYRGLLGAIKVETPEGIIFKIGSGFSDQQRHHPPKIGSIITYKYVGKTQRGVPRFASFLRIKNQH
tara:strand:+ start:5648 stop:6541 length:894 start_codon:yes stop_codon:yes gene_type:complete